MDKAKIFLTGRSQAVRLPKEYRFKGKDVYIKNFDNIVLLIPKSDPGSSLISSVEDFSDDFLNERTKPLLQLRGSIE